MFSMYYNTAYTYYSINSCFLRITIQFIHINNSKIIIRKDVRIKIIYFFHTFFNEGGRLKSLHP